MAEQFHFDPDTYLDMVRAEVPDYEQLQEIVADAAAELPAGTILDLGTGTGETLRRVAGRHPTARFVGIDESNGMLAVARKVVPGADLRVARLQDALPEGPFDLVVSALAVHHLDASEKAALFRKVAARLAPGGRFVLRVDEQLQWLRDAKLTATLRWRHRDLAVMVGDLTAP